MTSRPAKDTASLQRERKIQSFASDPKNFEKITRTVEAMMANAFREWTSRLGLKGDAYNDWIEDMVAEGFCLAWANVEKWDPDRGPDWNWVFLHAKSFASRWLKKLEKEKEAIDRLAEAMYPTPSHHSLRESDLLWASSKDDRLAVEALLVAELSLTQQRMLRSLHDGLCVREIAVDEGYSIETTQRYINRAQERTRKVMHLYEFHGQRSSDLPRPREPSSASLPSSKPTSKIRRPLR